MAHKGSSIMTNKTLSALGQRLNHRRLEQRLTQAAVASAANISAGYYSEIENGKCAPPPRKRMAKIFCVLGFSDIEIHELEILAVKSRGLSEDDVDLPDDVQALIREIRTYARIMNPSFIKGLRAKIREVVN
jgi:transcriptional regulator with XRE-family HTH domain